MNISKILLAGLVGLALGAALSRISTVGAQETGMVHVYITQEMVFNSNDKPSLNIPGGKVVGFSCVPKPTEKLNSQALCYIATSP